MSDKSDDLATYLQDHYAGGVGALELLERLVKGQERLELKGFFEELRADVYSDHEQLHHIMSVLEVKESSIRDATAWMAEKFSRPKLGFGTQKGLALLQALETLFMGISGKRMLWRALAKIHSSGLEGIDLQQLEARAANQLDRVETKRMEIAGQVLKPSSLC